MSITKTHLVYILPTVHLYIGNRTIRVSKHYIEQEFNQYPAPNFVQIYPKKFSSSSSSPYNSGSALAPALGGGRLGASPVFTGSVAGVWRGSLAPSLGTAIAVVTGTLVDVVVADAPADASLDRGALPPPLYAPAFVDFFAGEAAATADASTSPPISGSICDLPANSTLTCHGSNS